MLVCPGCAAEGWPAPGSACPACGLRPSWADGFPQFHPSLARSDEDYDPGYFQELASLEAGHWWFEARNALIIAALRSARRGPGRFLDLGCGTGFVLKALRSSLPELELAGLDIYPEALRIASARAPAASFAQCDARTPPFREHFDAVGAFDVLEHLREDGEALDAARRTLKPGGTLLLTVPQHPRLWSSADDQARHKRRYSRGELRAKLEAAGFRVARLTSFVTLLSPAMLVARARRPADEDKFAEFRPGRAANAALKAAMAVERGLSLGYRLPLPFGGSLFAAALRDR